MNWSKDSANFIKVEILCDREFMAELREGIRQANAGETLSLEQLKAELAFW